MPKDLPEGFGRKGESRTLKVDDPRDRCFQAVSDLVELGGKFTTRAVAASAKVDMRRAYASLVWFCRVGWLQVELVKVSKATQRAWYSLRYPGKKPRLRFQTGRVATLVWRVLVDSRVPLTCRGLVSEVKKFAHEPSIPYSSVGNLLAKWVKAGALEAIGKRLNRTYRIKEGVTERPLIHGRFARRQKGRGLAKLAIAPPVEQAAAVDLFMNGVGLEAVLKGGEVPIRASSAESRPSSPPRFPGLAPTEPCGESGVE